MTLFVQTNHMALWRVRSCCMEAIPCRKAGGLGIMYQGATLMYVVPIALLCSINLFKSRVLQINIEITKQVIQGLIVPKSIGAQRKEIRER